MGEQASTAVRNVRAIQQKRLRDMKVNKKARPDDLKRAGDKMEKIVEKGLQEVRRVTEGARKSLEG